MTLEELCAQLAKRRQELGLTIEEVVEKTKLYPSVIRDIEAGSINNIDSAYRKGFLKIYAAFLNVKVEDALEHISVFDAKVKNKTFQPLKVKRPSAVQKIKLNIKIPPQVKKFIVVFFIILCILWLGSNFIRFIGKKIKEAPKKFTVKQEVSRQRISTPVSQPKSKELSVTLIAKRECIVTVKVDGKSLFHGPFKKGDKDTWKGYKEISLKISDGSAVYVEVNGKPLPSLTSTRKPIKNLKVTPTGVSVDK